MRFERPLLCYVTDRRSLDGGVRPLELLAAKIAAAIAAGVDWVQIREKDLSARELSGVVREALSVARRNSSRDIRRILVNDRLDVALAEGAHGVHLAEKSISVADAKRIVATCSGGKGLKDFVVGASCHSRESAEAAAGEGADYISFGPVFATPSKAEFGPPQGITRLAEVCRGVSVPVIAIGGITQENAGSCIAAGAAGIAAIRVLQDAVDLRHQIDSLRARLSKA